MNKTGVDLVISFDTTGSMYPCLSQLRLTVTEAIRRLFKEIPDLRIGLIAHGDYCDAGSTYVTKVVDLTTNEDALCHFVRNVQATGGGDTPECYELVLHEARSLTWKAGKAKALVMIGDDIPHGPEYSLNTKKLNWRNELDCLQEMRVSVYGVQALNRRHATAFYEEIARKTGGYHLSLDQFSNVTELILGIAFKQEGDEKLKTYEAELVTAKKLNRNLDSAFSRMLNRDPSTGRFAKVDLDAVPPGRFQVMYVPTDSVIATFVSSQGVTFNPGRGFYQFTKPEKVQHHKEVVLMDKVSGDMFTGTKARAMLGLPEGEDARIKPTAFDKYDVFIQSTSYNRKLIGGTKFLYEVADYHR